MKRICAFVIVIVGVSVCPAFAQDSEVREPGSFSGIKVSEGIDVYLEPGEKETVRVEVRGTELSNILTEISGDYLKVHRRGNLFGNIEAKVYVTYVRLDKFSASSAGSIYSQSAVEARRVEISASSAGSVEIAIEAAEADVSCSSAGDVELKGEVGRIALQASSAGEIDAFDLQAGHVEAEASSGASIKLHVTEGLRARASSGGSIRYRGNPERSDTNSSSGGSVRKL